MGRTKGKLSKGQPQGNRSASGRKRDRAPRHLGPCEGVLRRRAEYGSTGDDETGDAIGRAWQAGLLHTDRERAIVLRDAGRKIKSQYWCLLGEYEPHDSLARYQPSTPRGVPDPVVEQIREDAFNIALGLVNARGHSVRKFFDDLVIDPNPDSGPAWLDRIIFAKRRGVGPSERDHTALQLAIEGLEAIS